MGFASQRLMAEGFGFGAEGDWKTAALTRTMWVMAQDFLVDVRSLKIMCWILMVRNSSILQSHMLEINPEIAKKPRIEVHFLGIGDAGVCATFDFPGTKVQVCCNYCGYGKSFPHDCKRGEK